MPRFWAALVAAALLAMPALAQSPSETREHEHIASAALGADLEYALYLPPGYAEAQGRFPVLYLLHGRDGNHLEWLHSGHLRETLDQMTARHQVSPMIVVMPDGGANSWYVDSRAVGGPGDYDDAISEELVAAIDHRFKTDPDPRRRGIGGLSMGGFGALRLTFRQPFRYAAAASLSGALWMRITPDDVPAAAAERVFRGTFGTPFDVKRFLAQAPYPMVEGLVGAKNPPMIFLAAGDHDRFRTYGDTFKIFMRLREIGVDSDLRITGGDHDWDTWAAQLPEVLLFFDRAFKRPEARG